MLTAARKFEDQPIVFIAINSGNSRTNVERYIRHNKIGWPVIVDADRSFEKAAGVGEVSLTNILQARIITATGAMRPANFADLEGSATRALAGAKWNVDGTAFPPAIKPAWKALEFGRLDLARAAITTGMKSRDAATKAAATQLNDYVQEQIRAEASKAWKLGTEKKLVEAYILFEQIKQRYQGYPIPENVDTASNWLGSQPVVKQEITAMKILEPAEKLALSQNSSLRSRGIKSLRILLSKYPESQSAVRAQEVLEEIGAAPK